jgi:uncharacterized membrane protein
MDPLWLALRIVHVGCGTFWVGSDLFLTFLLLPRLRGLGPQVERAVMTSLVRALPPVMTLSSVLTLVSGVWIAVTYQGWNPAWMLESGWGVAMLVGLTGTLSALVVGLGVIPPLTMRYDRMNRAVDGRGATPDEEREILALGRKISRLVHVNSVTLIVVVMAMAVARFV